MSVCFAAAHGTGRQNGAIKVRFVGMNPLCDPRMKVCAEDSYVVTHRMDIMRARE
jgi:hypothetical protein